jgi:hypothetical protein
MLAVSANVSFPSSLPFDESDHHHQRYSEAVMYQHGHRLLLSPGLILLSPHNDSSLHQLTSLAYPLHKRLRHLDRAYCPLAIITHFTNSRSLAHLLHKLLYLPSTSFSPPHSCLRSYDPRPICMSNIDTSSNNTILYTLSLPASLRRATTSPSSH